MMLAKKIIDDIIKKEGSVYTNDPSDLGGETKYGITKATALEYGYTKSMKDLDYDTAYQIYYKKYWLGLKLEDLYKIDNSMEILIKEIADTAVNMGNKVPIKFLQRSLNVLNQKQSLYKDILVDGILGNSTISAVNSLFKHRGDKTGKLLAFILNCLQANYYLTITESREENEKYFFGWISNRTME